jgi:hypothetical protein
MSCPAPIAAITTAGSKAAISPKLTFGWRGLMSAFGGPLMTQSGHPAVAGTRGFA